MSDPFFKKLGSSRWVGAFFLISAGLIVISAAQGQTPAPANSAAQIGPGNTGSISPAQGVNGAPADAPHQALKSALSPETRQTLLDAMNSDSPASNEVTLGPGEAAELDGATVDKIAFTTLPEQVKHALGNTIHTTLNDTAAH